MGEVGPEVGNLERGHSRSVQITSKTVQTSLRPQTRIRAASGEPNSMSTAVPVRSTSASRWSTGACVDLTQTLSSSFRSGIPDRHSEDLFVDVRVEGFGRSVAGSTIGTVDGRRKTTGLADVRASALYGYARDPEVPMSGRVRITKHD
jgi:hypothetical protein